MEGRSDAVEMLAQRRPPEPAREYRPEVLFEEFALADLVEVVRAEHVVAHVVTRLLEHAPYLDLIHALEPTVGPQERLYPEFGVRSRTTVGLDEERRSLGADRQRVVVTRREIEPQSREKHEDAYVAAIITRFGITPIVDQTGIDAARVAQERAASGEEPALIYGISGGVLASPETGRPGWWSGSGIATPDGAGLFEISQVGIDPV